MSREPKRPPSAPGPSMTDQDCRSRIVSNAGEASMFGGEETSIPLGQSRWEGSCELASRRTSDKAFGALVTSEDDGVEDWHEIPVGPRGIGRVRGDSHHPASVNVTRRGEARR